MSWLGCGFLFHIRYRIVAAVVAGVIAMLVLSATGYAHAQQSTVGGQAVQYELGEDWVAMLEGRTVSLASLVILLVMSAAFTIAFLIGRHPTIIFFCIASMVVSFMVAMLLISPQPIGTEVVRNGAMVQDYGSDLTISSAWGVSYREVAHPSGYGFTVAPELDSDIIDVLVFEQVVYVDKDEFWRSPIAYLFLGKMLFDGLYGIMLISSFRGVNRDGSRRD